MSNESRLLDLVIAWEELRAAGKTASPEELCSDCPELLEGLQERVRAIASVNAVLEAGDPPPVGVPAHTLAYVPPPYDPEQARRADWPSIPQYEILEELGRGGMGVVFKARQTALERTVALKTILAQGSDQGQKRRRFFQEAKAMALLRHPNIVQIHEVGQHGQHPFLVMEYVEGQSLSAALAGKPWPPRKAAELAATLARAVHAAHQHGVIHRDLKPTNVLLEVDGTPKICDFGLAKHFENSAQHTQTGQLLGTPSYMAPEQILDDGGSQGPAVDIYALGAVLYETLTGRAPFLADNPFDTLQLVVGQQPVPPRQWQPKTPRDLETICLKCLAKEPRRRYASALELAEDLRRFLDGRPIHARPAGLVERSWRWSRAHPSGAALVAVVVAAIVVVLTVVLAYNRRLAQELQRTATAHQQVLATQEDLHRTLTREVANRIDGDLRELATAPLTMATLLENRPDWNEQQLEEALRDMLEKAPLIFGLCVAFEPFQWRSDQRDFAFYVYRRAQGLAVKRLLPPDYHPHYRQWEWYRAGKDSPQGRWSEPYIGEGGDCTPMVTFSAPIRRSGRFVGVVTADLAMDYLHELARSVDRLSLGPESYCFVITSGQRILAHRFERYEFPNQDSDLTRLPVDPTFQNLIPRWSQTAEGSARALDFSTGRSALFLFSRVRASDWTLVTVVD